MDRIYQKINALGGIVSTADMANAAEYKRFQRAAQRGDITKLRSGVYAAQDMLGWSMLDIGRIVPDGVVCLYNAWKHYQLLTTIPSYFCVAIERKRKVVIPQSLPIALYYWKEDNLSLGVSEVLVSGQIVHMTNLERSVCDAVKYRNKIGRDVCAKILRNYLRKEERDIHLLITYAKQLRVYTTLSHYLEIVLE